MLERRLLEIPHRSMRSVYGRRNAGTIFMFSGNGVAKQCIAAPEPVLERRTPCRKLALQCSELAFLRRVKVELTMDQGVELCPPVLRCRLEHAPKPHPDQREHNDQSRCQGDTTKVHC